jgi:hypothetical protein
MRSDDEDVASDLQREWMTVFRRGFSTSVKLSDVRSAKSRATVIHHLPCGSRLACVSTEHPRHRPEAGHFPLHIKITYFAGPARCGRGGT